MIDTQTRLAGSNSLQEKELLTMNDYKTINVLYSYFPIVYKYIHGISLYNQNQVNDIESKILFVYKHFFSDDTTTVKEKIEALKTLEKDTYDELSHSTVEKILHGRKKDIKCYWQIKSIADEINTTKQKLRVIFNRENSLKDAFEIYEKNNGNITSNVIKNAGKDIFQKTIQSRQEKRVVENILQNNPESLNPTKKQKPQINNEEQKVEEIVEQSNTPLINIESKEDKALRKIKNKIKILEFNIANEIGTLFDDFKKQLDGLIRLSLKGGEKIEIDGEIQIDKRYDSFFNAATNKQAAVVFIQQFLHENKPDNVNIKGLRYFSYNTGKENEKYLTNDDITENIAELFIKKIELARHQDKNT